MSQAKRWVTGVTDLNEEEVVAELRERVYREVVALWEAIKLMLIDGYHHRFALLAIAHRFR